MKISSRVYSISTIVAALGLIISAPFTYAAVSCPSGYTEYDSGSPNETGEGLDLDRTESENQARDDAQFAALSEIADAEIDCNSNGNNYFDSDYEEDLSCILTGNEWECDYSIDGEWICCEIEV